VPTRAKPASTHPKNASGGKKIHPARSRYFYLESGSKSTDPLVTFIPPEEDSFHPAADSIQAWAEGSVVLGT
jgi:hypothetical protein